MVKWSQYRDRLPKPIEIKRFFTSHNTNLGIICGGEFGLVVVDFDTENGYDQFISKMPKGLAEIFKKTYRVKTPRGMHVYLKSFNVPSMKDIKRKIDIKSDGGYVVAPFSTHPSGKSYKDYNEFNVNNILSIPSKTLLSLFPQEEKKACVDWDNMNGYKKESNGVFPTPNSDLDEIRAYFPILRVAMDYTAMFPERGGRSSFWRGRCPLPEHDDKDPSFWVDTETGFCGCFGNCALSKRSTDVIGLYALINGISYGDAVKELSQKMT